MNPSDKLKKLKNYFKDDNIKCLDIGANIGQFYQKFKQFFPNSYIYLIEANPYCKQYLESTGAEYKIVALSNEIKTIPFYTAKNKALSKGASFYPESPYDPIAEQSILKFNLTTSTLDLEFPKETFNLVKMDVQGSELDIILGGTNLLNKSDFLLIEVSFTEYNKGAPLARQIVKELENLNFFVVDTIDEHHDSKNNLVQVDFLFSKYVNSHNQDILKYYNV